ncbi:MAG TPA: trypsin-like peptidase domain-containing protein [Candidatus Moranbacteria bacterium]|nr:trypsin-like peptidase domain-containing protein [Candidatus Moranbacteria bacterium]
MENIDDKKNNFSDRPKNWRIPISVLIITILLSSAFGAIFGFMAGSVGQKITDNKYLGFLNKSKTEIIKQNIIQEDSAVISVVEKTTPAVVSIIITKDVPKMRSFFSDPFGFPDFFGNFGEDSNETQKQQIGGGSGFIVSNDGMIVTNKHVVSDSGAEYTVITNDGQEHPAKILAQDPTNDIAIIKIEGSGFPTLDFGNSNDLKIGQTVIAIGNSLGEFSNTVSRGIISGLRRNVTAGSGFGDTEQLTNTIQTDAAINPGNSGGPLLNISGEVIGVNVAMAQGAQSIGFAIPSVQIKKVVEQVGTTGKISTPFIGVRYLAVNSAIAKENNLPFNYGALVIRGETLTDLAVIPGSPADKAGIVENDIILEINGTKIDDKNGLANLIAQHNVGDELALKIWHKGETKEVKLKLEERK